MYRKHGRIKYAAWFCTKHPRGIIVTGHTGYADSRVSVPGRYAEGWRMRMSADLEDADRALDERGWRRTADWESVASGYLRPS